MKNYRSARWILLILGLIAIIALTGLNVYTLYNLRDTRLEADHERRNRQLKDISIKLTQELNKPFFGLDKLNLISIDSYFKRTGEFPTVFKEEVLEVLNSELFTDVYYTPYEVNPCESEPILRYDSEANAFMEVISYPKLVCDGTGVARTRVNTIFINNFDDAPHNNVIGYDTHRTLNIALMNTIDRSTIGYLTFVFSKENLVNFIKPSIIDEFGNEDDSKVAVWLHDWVHDEVLATNAPNLPFSVDLVDYRENLNNFPDWNLKIRYNTIESGATYTTNLIKDLLVLSAAVFMLIGALLFMFRTAQKERKLAIRQADFIANVTHELKTPLAVMQAAGENIADGRVTEQNRLQKYGDHIYHESIRLRKMIEKLLDVAKVDAGRALIKPAPHNLGELTASFIEHQLPYLSDKGFTVTEAIAKNVPVSMIDPDSFETILSNLTENAVKYSAETKHIHYEVAVQNGNVICSITDKGVGIPSKEQRFIFDKFYRVEDPLTATTKGHGLGLSIIKNHVNLNNGSITLESNPGSGTTFSVSFPIFIDNSVSQAVPNPGSPENKQSNKNNIEYVG